MSFTFYTISIALVLYFGLVSIFLNKFLIVTYYYPSFFTDTGPLDLLFLSLNVLSIYQSKKYRYQAVKQKKQSKLKRQKTRP